MLISNMCCLAPYLVQEFQCQYDLTAVQSNLLLFEVDPLHQVCEELSPIHIVCNQSLASAETHCFLQMV